MNGFECNFAPVTVKVTHNDLLVFKNLLTHYIILALQMVGS